MENIDEMLKEKSGLAIIGIVISCLKYLAKKMDSLKSECINALEKLYNDKTEKTIDGLTLNQSAALEWALYNLQPLNINEKNLQEFIINDEQKRRIEIVGRTFFKIAKLRWIRKTEFANFIQSRTDMDLLVILFYAVVNRKRDVPLLEKILLKYNSKGWKEYKSGRIKIDAIFKFYSINRFLLRTLVLSSLFFLPFH